MTVHPDPEVTIAQLTRVGFVVGDHGLLLSALVRPSTSLFGSDTYPSLELKIAALMDSIINNHPMVDGNKRSAWLIANMFAEFNDHEIVAATDEAFAFILRIATCNTELAPHAQWISDHLEPLNP